MRVQVDIKKNGQVVVEVLDRNQGEHCTVAAHRLVQGLSVESDEIIGPDCDEVHETTKAI
jgi:hypothetical protein